MTADALGKMGKQSQGTNSMTDSSRDPRIDATLLARLERCTNLPSPPVIGMRVIELAQDPDVDIGKIADVVSMDPALAAKILRVANSPIYAMRRKSENLRQAITQLGLNGTLMLALSFSLAATMHNHADQGFDYRHFWRRSLAAATCARRLGMAVRLRASEELFLAGLLQDIGMLVLDKLNPHFYRKLESNQADHAAVRVCEQEALGADHAMIGGWILGKWGLPDYLIDTVTGSHDADFESTEKDGQRFLHCVALSGQLVDAVSRCSREEIEHIAALAFSSLNIDHDEFMEMLSALESDFRDAEAMFETDLTDYCYSDSLLDSARETLMMRNLQTLQQADRLQETADILESRTRELEERSRRDGLTGLFNRAYLDECLVHEFNMARERDWPMIVMFVDLDHFKRVNDSYGHQVGDQVLQRVARTLVEGVRENDLVARFGGEEFVVIAAGRGEKTALVMAERLVGAFRALQHPVDGAREITVTVSIGIAILGEGFGFPSAEEMVVAADKALYAAKRRGRNRYIVYSDYMDKDLQMIQGGAG
jgi:diguanylate cyclase (GGDEF)-like protein